MALFAVAALALAPAALAEPAHVGYPSSIAALGDSDSTGFDSQSPGRDAPRNSWSTGDNPAVKSHYLRILAANPRIRNHNYDFAKDGSGTDDLIRQAKLALPLHPDYVTIETGGNDICLFTPMPLPTFRAHLSAALRFLGKGAPNARILVTSPPWDNEGYDRVFGPYEVAHGYTSDGSACDPGFDKNGVPDPARDAAIKQLFDSYDAALASVCAQFLHCRYDGSALNTLVPVMTDFSFLSPTDNWAYSHPSIQGLARMSTASWPTTFDFADALPPASKAVRAGRTVTLNATDNVGVAGVEYRLAANSAWVRYTKPVTIPKGKTLTWRAVDVNGNCEATHSLK